MFLLTIQFLIKVLSFDASFLIGNTLKNYSEYFNVQEKENPNIVDISAKKYISENCTLNISDLRLLNFSSLDLINSTFTLISLSKLNIKLFKFNGSFS
jgi:uncharacterized protein YjbI with pentapeptide repeats